MSLLSPIPTTPTPSLAPPALQTSILSLPDTLTHFLPIDVRFLTKAKEDVDGGSIVTPTGIPDQIFCLGQTLALVPAAKEGVRPFCGVLSEVAGGSKSWVLFRLKAVLGADCLLLIPKAFARIRQRDKCRIALTPATWLNAFPPLLAVFHPQPVSFTVDHNATADGNTSNSRRIAAPFGRGLSPNRRYFN
ncbi:hypothetical protein FOMPIDRAFT_1056821 [Fomitopsis schrenkii]|uniref:Uncharacterized protein n=1 Tax=Fomitopsis schrenkii TaxID=2126942 RepID=S8DFX9_FOMSC|nr:hypothetical protein FOMPIDRAFT_1056822 [Fomitopsis schrenkii]EPS92491.1 hypothetical protein FOMPIDRAFT_1056821 [Fomitopsis schrenkii]